jgi:TetR/AcrR family transcriptional regulator
VVGDLGPRRAEGPSGSFSFVAAGEPGPRVFVTLHVMTEGRGRRGLDPTMRRERIVEVAMRQFAEHGYRHGRVEDIARQVGVAKGTVFLDFGSKQGLFLAAYRRAVSMLPAWLDAPADVVDRGFWTTLDWWLARTEQFNAEDWIPNRIAMIGRYDTGLELRGPIGRFMRSEDPYGTLEFVEFGVKRGEIRGDVDAEMMASVLDWVAERFQDALSEVDLDPGLIHRMPERREMRIKEFVEVLRGGIAPQPEDGP